MMGAEPVLLDLFSTSQTNDKKCINHAPYICVPESEKPGYLAQGCCNDWNCPRCGELRAKHEYGRMVHGARELAKDHTLYFMTLTCRGDITLEEAEANYLAQTNRLMTSFRANAKRHKQHWFYASVTERQPKRKHPHSHYLITAAPKAAFPIIDDYQGYLDSVFAVNEQIDASMRFTAMPKENVSLLDYHSEWLMLASVKAGLGVQCRVSIVDSVEACSRYIAKYLFKETAFDVWPKGWKRVRYSQNWPKLPEQKNERAFVVLSAWDWYLAADSGTLLTRSRDVLDAALRHGCGNVKLQEAKTSDI